MTFTAYTEKPRYIIMTDDYSLDEISRGIHIKLILRDFKTANIKNTIVRIYDEYNNLVAEEAI